MLKCNHTETVFVGVILKNGSVHIQKKCLLCKERFGRYYSNSDFVLELLEVIDLRDETACERCGSLSGVEIHHWAPRHLFNDSMNWPKSKLCTNCHTLWHNTVTPNMYLVKK